MNTPAEIERVMGALSPQARIALHALSELQHRPAEDVLRDEIRTDIEGRVPSIDIDGAMRSIQNTAYNAGYMIGCLRRIARGYGEDDQCR